MKGKDNYCTDMLSWLGSKSEPSDMPTHSDDDDRVIITALTLADSETADELIQASSEDWEFLAIKQYLHTEWPPRKTLPEKIRGYFDVRNELSFHNACLYQGERLCIPTS
ncbi:MAG: hypothetical protein GY696_13235, partial [Gammaproteobacteria bacterium]|nr:hypothetical protein [Gammaproteobacteria bacterium]